MRHDISFNNGQGKAVQCTCRTQVRALQVVFLSITDSNKNLKITGLISPPCHSNIRWNAVIAPAKQITRTLG